MNRDTTDLLRLANRLVVARQRLSRLRQDYIRFRDGEPGYPPNPRAAEQVAATGRSQRAIVERLEQELLQRGADIVQAEGGVGVGEAG